MKKKKFLQLIMIGLFIITFSNCSDEPELPETRSYDMPILFETEGMEWFTEYDMVNNVYCTTITSGEINYVAKSKSEIPEDMIVTHVIKEQDGNKKAYDVSKIKELAETGNGFYEYEVELLKFVYTEKGKFRIILNYDSEEYEYRYYHIVLQSKDSKFGTQIKIDDRIVYDTGLFPIKFDLSGLKYPSKRHYNKNTGYYKGFGLSIYLPSEECEVELSSKAQYCIDLISLFDSETQTTTDLYKFVYNFEYDQFHEINQPPKTVLTECGEFRYVENEDNSSTMHSKIYKNTTGKERIISVHLYGAGCTDNVYFIQAAK